jgi:hypothetical protein
MNPQWNFTSENEKLLALGVHNKRANFNEVVAARYARKDEISSRLNLQPADIGMDLGSGMGFIAEVIAPMIQRLHCCDISTSFIADCKTRTEPLEQRRLPPDPIRRSVRCPGQADQQGLRDPALHPLQLL